MIIKADRDAITFIRELCDLALKQGGIKNLEGVNHVLMNITEIEADEEEES